jgi:hypothetical protein
LLRLWSLLWCVFGLGLVRGLVYGLRRVWGLRYVLGRVLLHLLGLGLGLVRVWELLVRRLWGLLRGLRGLRGLRRGIGQGLAAGLVVVPGRGCVDRTGPVLFFGAVAETVFAAHCRHRRPLRSTVGPTVVRLRLSMEWV